MYQCHSLTSLFLFIVLKCLKFEFFLNYYSFSDLSNTCNMKNSSQQIIISNTYRFDKQVTYFSFLDCLKEHGHNFGQLLFILNINEQFLAFVTFNLV